MENNCLNCNHPIIDNFCSNCGQKKFKRIDRKYLIDEVQYLVVHTNKGFFYSIKNILKNPGKTARQFIDGNRVNHYKPILLAFVLSGISAFISFKIIEVNTIMQDYFAQQKMPKNFMNDIMSFISSYNSAIMLLLLPLVSILTKLVFRKWGQNYYEHVIMNTYIQCFYTIISILFLYPILYFTKNNSNIFMVITTLSSFVTFPLIMVWFYKEFYKDKSLGSIILRVLLFCVIGFVIYMGISIATGIFLIINNPEMLKEFAPKK